MLRASGVGHRYLARQPLLFDGLELNVSGGESVAITGPSGRGKTTLLLILGGLLVPTKGVVARDITNAEISWILQGMAVLPARSVIDNVLLERRITVAHHRSRSSRHALRKDAEEALDALGLSGLEHRRGRLLSGGEAKRVAVARAIVSKRQLLLADEPTAQLDSRSAKLAGGCLADLARDGRAVVVVTHDEAVASLFGRRLVLSESGLTES